MAAQPRTLLLLLVAISLAASNTLAQAPDHRADHKSRRLLRGDLALEQDATAAERTLLAASKPPPSPPKPKGVAPSPTTNKNTATTKTPATNNKGSTTPTTTAIKPAETDDFGYTGSYSYNYKGYYGQRLYIHLTGAPLWVDVTDAGAAVWSGSGYAPLVLELVAANSGAEDRQPGRVYLKDEFKLKYGDYSLYADPESKQFVASLTDFTRFKLETKYTTCDANAPEYEVSDLNRIEGCPKALNCVAKCGKRVISAYVDGGWKRVGRGTGARSKVFTWTALGSGWTAYEMDLPV